MPRYFAATLADLTHGVLSALIGTVCKDNVGLAIGTTTTKVKTANATTFSIGGVNYTKAATDDCFAHSDLTVQPAASTLYYGLFLDSSGTGSIIRGTSTKLPAFDPSLLCMVGYLKVVTVGSTFTPGTTAHTSVTTYVNTSVPPATLA